MAFFTSYILSLVGIILLGVIVDLVLVDGQVKKYVRSIYVLFVIFTLVAPLPTLVNNVKKGDFNVNTSEITIDKSYLDIICEQRNGALEKAIITAFEDDGLVGVAVRIDATYEKEYIIDKIAVDISKLNVRITKSRAEKIILSVIKIDKEAIVIHE